MADAAPEDFDDDDVYSADEPVRWALPLTLFALTVVTTLSVGAQMASAAFPGDGVAQTARCGHYLTAAALVARWIARGWPYTVPLMAILLCHEFGHYAMARRHRVPATLPMFIPVPLPPFGTMGAVIRMRGRIRTNDALLDIGAAGPLAGLLVAIPITYIGLRLSPVLPVTPGQSVIQEGTSLLYALLRYLAKGAIPPGHDVNLHPVAMAGWVGLFVTMLNLIPYGQLDGGHIAYALLGRFHDRYARYLVWILVALGVATGLYWGTVLRHQHRDPWRFGTGYTQGFNWVMYAALIRLLHRGTGGRHPPTEPGPLSPSRRIIAAVTLACFALLFIPVPLRDDSYPDPPSTHAPPSVAPTPQRCTP